MSLISYSNSVDSDFFCVSFRHLVLVTVNDTDPGEVAAARSLEGNGNHTLMLRLNGAPVAGLGANMVPMEIMEGRYGTFRNPSFIWTRFLPLSFSYLARAVMYHLF